MTAGRAVVVGSGMGGLVAANLLAMHGWSVTVLEQHYRPGGFLHRFFRHGVGFDTGFHYVGSIGRHELFGRMMHHLGVLDQVQWRALDPEGFDELRFPDFEVRVPVGLERWIDRLVALFPGERDGLRAYLETTRAAVETYAAVTLDFTRSPMHVLPWEERSLQSVLDEHIRDPRLAAVLSAPAALYGVPPADAPFGMHAVVTDHFLHGAWTIEGGGDSLARVLVRALRARGGQLVLRARVAHVDTHEGRATRVHTEDGRSWPCDLVVGNTHPATVADWFDDGTFRKAYLDRVHGSRPGLPHFGLYLRVDGDLRPYADRNVYRYHTWDVNEIARPATPAGVPFYFMSAPGGRSSGRLPGADRVVLALVLTDWETFAPWADAPERPEAYQVAKSRLSARIVADIERDFGWRVTWSEASTPLTTREFTGSRYGATYGHYHGIAQMGRYRLPVRARVPNLLHVGQCVGFPGICGAAATAYVACAEVLGPGRLSEELSAG